MQIGDMGAGKANGRSGRAAHLADLTPDPKNRRKHNPKNIGMLVNALHSVGAARSIVIDEHNEVLAGNGVVEAAGEAGITKVRVVEADGDTLVAVRRTGLSDEQKRLLAMYDNRVAELAEWNWEQLGEDAANGLDLKPFEFSQAQMAKVGGDVSDAEEQIAEQWMVVVQCRDENEQRALLDRLIAEGMNCRAVAS